MGELIDLQSYFDKKRRMRESLPQIKRIFMKNMILRKDEHLLTAEFIEKILMDPSLPALSLDDNQLLYLDYQLQRHTVAGTRNLSQVLYYSRLHMEKVLKISLGNTAGARRFIASNPGKERIVRFVTGMVSLAWQAMEDDELVIDSISMQKRHAKKQTPEV
jgi:hypothetical protein